MKKVLEDIQQWSIDKGLSTGDSFKQFAKHSEELAEYLSATTIEEKKLELGDCVVTTTIIAQQNDINIMECIGNLSCFSFMHAAIVYNGQIAEALCKKDNQKLKDAISYYMSGLDFEAIKQGLSLNDCAEAAYQKVSNRKSRMVDGVLTKESDLKEKEQ